MRILSILFFLMILINSCCKSPSKKDFISVAGSEFILHGSAYKFIGFNMWYSCYLGASEEGRQRLVKELDTLKSLGFTNLRILGASENTSGHSLLSRAIQISPGIYDEELLKGLDFVLAEMGKRGIYAVIYLNNYWQWSGGMSQYVNWSTGIPVPNPNETGGGEGFMQYSARFYSDSVAVKMNRNYIKMLVNRKNSYSGLLYKNDPAIMAWELANEPRPGPDGPIGEKNVASFISWNHETAKFIHSIDPNHLVTTGSEGKVGSIQNEELFLKTHSDPAIDFVNLHLWAKNWGWFDAKRIDSTLPVSIANAREYINLHIALARKLAKPITMEEFGLERDSGATAPFSPVKARNEYFSFVLKLFTDSAVTKSPLAGVNVWAWGGFGKPETYDKVLYKPGAFLGDPFDEPQGLNSVYITDSSTLNILHRASQRLKRK